MLMVTLANITACGSVVDGPQASETSAAPRWPATNNYEVPDGIANATMVWSAESGIDLFSIEGTLARATYESVAIGWMVGLDYTYIGFPASSNSVPGGPLYSTFRAETGDGPFAGTVNGHIQQIIPTDTGFDAISCLLTAGLDVSVDGKYAPSGLTNGGGQELRSRFIRVDDIPSVHLSVASSPTGGLHWQAPTDNRFAGWKIDGLIDIDPITSGTGRCNPWARSLYPDTTPVIPRDAYANEDPPPVQPAYPGWPDGSN
ncbi:hypothetical protein [Rhodococcus sp. KRD162]|uniref:hypothetical protein n=1 Tax=Rhodococcus sp. KRD162 TaxID=2729725 RepID=UPI0019D30472|nr:hypothetical protein [Rhodococcus sp. KRD162]